MWQAYYAKQRVRLFGLLVVTLREQYHFSWATATSTAFRLARAAAVFGDARGNYEAVLPDLTRAYQSIRSHSDAAFEPSAVARDELAWWVARRVPDARAPEHVGALIAQEYADMYGASLDAMLEPGVLRARAAAMRDAEASQPDWPTISALLRQSYRTLRAQLSTAPRAERLTGSSHAGTRLHLATDLPISPEPVLAHSGARLPSVSMQPRAVRVSLLETVVRFNGRDATLVNISRSGALLRMREPVPVGEHARLLLSQRSTTIEIDGRVVRADEGGPVPVDVGDDRHVGITFVAPPPPEVTALLRRLIART